MRRIRRCRVEICVGAVAEIDRLMSVVAGWKKAIQSLRPSTSLRASLRPSAERKRALARGFYGPTKVGPFRS